MGCHRDFFENVSRKWVVTAICLRMYRGTWVVTAFFCECIEENGLSPRFLRMYRGKRGLSPSDVLGDNLNGRFARYIRLKRPAVTTVTSDNPRPEFPGTGWWSKVERGRRWGCHFIFCECIEENGLSLRFFANVSRNNGGHFCFLRMYREE